MVELTARNLLIAGVIVWLVMSMNNEGFTGGDDDRAYRDDDGKCKCKKCKKCEDCRGRCKGKLGCVKDALASGINNWDDIKEECNRKGHGVDDDE